MQDFCLTEPEVISLIRKTQFWKLSSIDRGYSSVPSVMFNNYKKECEMLLGISYKGNDYDRDHTLPAGRVTYFFTIVDAKKLTVTRLKYDF
jgi:hypothetical protein